jgi:hypothetical protein
MASNVITREHQRLLEVAREYRQRGYDVVIEPKPEQLPDFLKPFRLDLIARNNTETVVVEIRSQTSLVEVPQLDAVAQALHNRPGWRFELVVTNPKDQTLLRLKDERLLDRDDIGARLHEARQLSIDEHGEAALLLAWSATEAVLRQLAADAELPVDLSNTGQLIKSLFVYGVLDQAQYQGLQAGLQARNLVAHGYTPHEFNAQVVEQVIQLAEKLAS